MKKFNLTLTIEWIAAIFVLSGSLMTSLQLTPYNIYTMNIGSMLFIWWAIRIKDNAMIAVNGGLVLIYLIGIVKSLL
jgi:hypothetical protein